MSTEDVILLVVCLVIALGAIGGGVLAFRRTARRTTLAVGIGAGVAVIGAYLAGIAALVWRAVRAVVEWGAGLAAEPSGIPGLVVLLVGVITIVASIVLGRRSTNRSNTSSFQLVSRSKESPRQRRRRERAEEKQRKAEAAAADRAEREEQKQARKSNGKPGVAKETADAGRTGEAPPAVSDHVSRPPAPGPGQPIEDVVPERPSDPTAAGQLPPQAPGR